MSLNLCKFWLSLNQGECLLLYFEPNFVPQVHQYPPLLFLRVGLRGVIFFIRSYPLNLLGFFTCYVIEDIEGLRTQLIIRIDARFVV